MSEHSKQSTHLVKRGSRYYIRRRIPLDLVDHYQRAEIMRSLQTSDIRRATVLCREASAELDKEFLRVRHGTNDKVRTEKMTSDSAVATLFEYSAEQNATLEVDSRREELRQMVREILEEMGFNIPARSLDARVSKPFRISTVQNDKIASTYSIVALVKAWEKERKPRIRTVRAYQRSVYLFRKSIGNLPVPTITKSMVVSFKDSMLAKGMTALATNAALSHISALLSYAVGQAWIETNPAAKVRIVLKSDTRLGRVAFSERDLNAIFSCPIYSEAFRTKAGAGEAAYWLPLLGLFTGARIEELCQLTPKDVRVDTYRDSDGAQQSCYVLILTNEGEGQTLKNSSSRRRFPIHKELLSRGFIKYVDSRKNQERIFPVTVDTFGSKSTYWSQWFHRYLRDTIKIVDPRLVFHSFRHTFKHVCRECGIDKGIRDAFQGHGEGGAAGEYGGEWYPLRPLVTAMETYHVAGVTLPK